MPGTVYDAGMNYRFAAATAAPVLAAMNQQLVRDYCLTMKWDR